MENTNIPVMFNPCTGLILRKKGEKYAYHLEIVYKDYEIIAIEPIGLNDSDITVRVKKKEGFWGNKLESFPLSPTKRSGTISVHSQLEGTGNPELKGKTIIRFEDAFEDNLTAPKDIMLREN